MAASNSETKQVSFFKLNAKCDKDNTPRFYQIEKLGDKWQKTKAFDTISGTFHRASIKEFQYEGATQRTFHIELSDPGETIAIDMSHTSLAYSIINTLLGVKQGEFIRIKVYRNHDKENNKFYPKAVFLNALTDDVDKSKAWRIDIKTVPRSIPVMVGDKPFFKDGKQVYDDTAVKAYWEQVFTNDIISKFTQVKNSDDLIPDGRSLVTEVPDSLPLDDGLPF